MRTEEWGKRTEDKDWGYGLRTVDHRRRIIYYIFRTIYIELLTEDYELRTKFLRQYIIRNKTLNYRLKTIEREL